MSGKRASRLLLVLLSLSAAANAFFWIVLRGPADQPQATGIAGGDAWPLRPRLAQAGMGVGASVSADASADGDGEKLAVLRDLESVHLQAARELADRYWSAEGDYQSAYTRALGSGLEALRVELLSRYGEAAKDDPVFRALFRPLDPLYWFLNSDQQLAIQKLRLERDLALQSAARSASDVAGGMPSVNGAPAVGGVRSAGAAQVPGAVTLSIMQKYQAGLAGLLDPQTLLEFELRDSAIAGQLRASGLEFSEREFREAYALMAELQQQPAAIGAVIAVRDRLRELLGRRRFAALWAARDPTYAQLAGIAERHSLPEGMALTIYELMDEYQARRMQSAGKRGIDPARAAGDALALAEDERRALARLVGEEIADEIIRGRALQSYRLFGGTGRPEPAFDRQGSQGG